MPIHILRNQFRNYVFILLWLVITACNAPRQNASVTDTPENLTLPTASATAADPAAPGPIAILLTSPETDAASAAQVEAALSEFGAQNGLEVEKRAGLDSTDLPDGLRIVVALAPDPGIVALAAAAPQVQFIAIGITGVQAGGNLTVIGAEGGNAEQLGFMAGYTAALITEDWRVGVISTSDSVAGQLARESFMVGVRYFCGLCLQTYPPYYDYPLFVEQPAGASAEQWRNSANQLLNNGVKTVYVAPGVGDNSLLEYLAQSGVVIIGSVPPPEQARAAWVATLQVDFLRALREALAQAFAGQGGENIPMAPEFQYVNPEILSSGKLANIKAVQDELVAGYILPVEP